MKKYLFLCISFMSLATTHVMAQDKGYTERAKKYIEQYYNLAIYEQRKSGIPASITLGQGILETEAGASELMTEANNHFGIKCKSGYSGPFFRHTDDAPNEHFKKYNSAAESYSDHSALLLNNPRYAPLLVLPKTDYAAWAKCLKKCGYATNPHYAQQLIKIIEDFKLQEYTYSALDSSLRNKQSPVIVESVPFLSLQDTSEVPMASPDTAVIIKNIALGPSPVKHYDTIHPATAKTIAPATVMAHAVIKNEAMPVAAHHDSVKATATHARTGYVARETPVMVPAAGDFVAEQPKQEESHVVIVNGLRAFYAYKDEMILQYAMKYHIGYHQLLSMNDLTDGPLPGNMYIYLQRKLTKGTNAQHEMREGESLLMAAQAEGMQLKSLREMNRLNPGEEPVPGAILELQKTARNKPAAVVEQGTAHTRNAIVINNNEQPNTAGGDYIVLNKTRQATFADTAKPSLAITSSARKPAVVALPEEAHVPDAKNSLAIADGHTIVARDEPIVAKEQRFYTVKKGDTAYSIAKRNNITLAELMKWNRTDGHLAIGQNLQVKR